MKKALVTVISLGGTISCTPVADGNGVIPTLDAAALVGSLGEEASRHTVTARTWSTRDSSEITFDELTELADEIRRQYDLGAQGVVITQGTDTIDETAFALDVLLGPEFPVVVTGAMRDSSRPGSDGAANLQASLLVATCRELREIGTVVVLNDEIHTARWVRKINTSSPAAFQSPGVGAVGWITENHPVFIFKPFQVAAAPIDAQTGKCRVALITATMDDDPAIIDFIVSQGFHGLVVAGMGGGHVNGALARALGSAAQKIPVVYTSRTGSGNVLLNTYDSPGAEIDLIHRGLIPAGSLDGLKSRILLTLLLKSGAEKADISAAFAAHGGYSQHHPLSTESMPLNA